jgi:hypothetical protein
MKLFRMRTLAAFGLGFLAGSRAGRGPWEKAEATMEQLKGMIGRGSMGGGSMSSNGFDGQRSQAGSGMPPKTEGRQQLTEF